MFYNCGELRKLNLSNFNTNKVTDMKNIFECSFSLEELNLNSFNTNKVTSMRYMFWNCISLKKLNLSNFNTNKVTDMTDMFRYCLPELLILSKDKKLFNDCEKKR